MIPLTKLAHEAVARVIKTGDIAIDLTAGNGHDTLFLARGVGPTGHVYAFDIQSSAIQATKDLLTQHSMDAHVTLQMKSHAHWGTMIPNELMDRIQVIMMNLGYLPGSDKSLVTHATATLAAIDSAVDLLKPGGLLTVLAYTGHPGGQIEADAVHGKLEKLDSVKFEYKTEPAQPTKHSPVLHRVSKKNLNT